MRRLRAAQCAWVVIAASAAPLAVAQAVFDAPASNFKGRVFSAGALPGQQATVTGRGFVPGQTVTLSYGAQALLADPVTVNAEGGFSATVKIAPQTAPGLYPVVVQAVQPTAALVTDLKVSPDVPLSGQDHYALNSQAVRAGLYQVAYGAASNSLFTTSSPRNDGNKLFKLNPDTLEVQAQTDVEVAAFGLTVDDAKATVWVTNSPAGTVAVYRQGDLSLVQQFEKGLAPHARDVAVDAREGKAYVSTMESRIVVFDTNSNTLATPVAIQSTQRGGKFSAFGLTLDAQAHKLYATSLETGEVAIVDTRSDTVEKVIKVDGVKGATGVTVDPQSQRLFVVAQGSDNVAVVDIASGKTMATVAVGASPLNVTFDPARRHAYVSTRGAATVTVLDVDGKIVANLPSGGTFANHAAVDGKGDVYVVVNRPRGADDPQLDRILRIAPKS